MDVENLMILIPNSPAAHLEFSSYSGKRYIACWCGTLSNYQYDHHSRLLVCRSCNNVKFRKYGTFVIGTSEWRGHFT